MDYCYDPNAPIVLPPTSSPTAQIFSGCSAEVRACPGGSIVYQDPDNGCEFAPCPKVAKPTPPPTASPVTPPPTASPVTLPPTADGSTFYCGYSVGQVNDNCARAKPCPSGLDNQCDGLEVCIRNTVCGLTAQTMTTTSTAAAAMTAAAPSEADLCNELCVDALPSEWCPEETANLNIPNCLEVEIGRLCESDGECGTDDALNNCGTYDIYARVVCGGNTISQGELMRTRPPVPKPSPPPTPLPPTDLPTTKGPTTSPITVLAMIDAMKTEAEMAAAARDASMVADRSSSASISIADAIDSAIANPAASEPSQSTETSTPAPNKEYESNAASAVTYDRSPGGGNGATPGAITTGIQPEEPIAMGSNRSPGGGNGEVSGTMATEDGADEPIVMDSNQSPGEGYRGSPEMMATEDRADEPIAMGSSRSPGRGNGGDPGTMATDDGAELTIAVDSNQSPGGGNRPAPWAKVYEDGVEVSKQGDSTQSYNSQYSEESFSDTGANNNGWDSYSDFDAYFRGPTSRNSGNLPTASLAAVVSIMSGIALAVFLALIT